MNLILYNKNPWKWMNDMNRDFDDFWDFPMERKKQAFPACDFHEDKDHCFISMDLPGMKKEDIQINYENKLLTVSGKREEEYREEDKKDQSRFVEKFYGSFSRSFNLSSAIDEDKISAHFANGVLELVLPRTMKSRGKAIPVVEGKRKLFPNSLKNKKE